MKKEEDIRWIQRFINYRKALLKLSQAVNLIANSFNSDKGVAEEIYETIVTVYYPLFVKFERTMLPLSGKEYAVCINRRVFSSL